MIAESAFLHLDDFHSCSILIGYISIKYDEYCGVC